MSTATRSGSFVKQIARPYIAVGAPGPLLWAGTLLLLAALVWGYRQSGYEVVVIVDGYPERIHTHRTAVEPLLYDLGLNLHPQDRVLPGLHAALNERSRIVIERARPLAVQVDGREVEHYTHRTTISAALAEAGIELGPYDEVELGGTIVPHDTPLPALSPIQATRFPPARAWADTTTPPLELIVRRAIPIHIQDNGAPFTIHTTAPTLAEALEKQSIVLHPNDIVRPELDVATSAGLRVFIERATPARLHVDGFTVTHHTHAQTVADLLREMNIVVLGKDIVEPAMDTPIYENIDIQITRVTEAITVEQDVIPFETVVRGDDNLEIDNRIIAHPGAEGITKRRYRVVYYDGEAVEQELLDEWVAQEAHDRVIAYGRKVVPKTLETPQGTITYWRKVRMLATSYSKSTAGVSPSAPWFGRTRLGWPMRHGIVAVDPNVVNLGSRVYVPGYGIGDAADTGGGILGRRIDLGYDDHNLVHWYRWVDVYLLWPPPPAHQIRYTLPNWPRENR